jgi:hypothetical protein
MHSGSPPIHGKDEATSGPSVACPGHVSNGLAHGPPRGSGAAAPSGALRAIDASARPRSWRTFGPRRLAAAISSLPWLPPRVVPQGCRVAAHAGQDEQDRRVRTLTRGLDPSVDFIPGREPRSCGVRHSESTLWDEDRPPESARLPALSQVLRTLEHIRPTVAIAGLGIRFTSERRTTWCRRDTGCPVWRFVHNE